MNTTDILWNWFSNIVIGGIGLSALFMACAKFFGVNLLKLWLAKDLEKYKSELDAKNKEIQAQLDTKIELLKIKENQLYKERLDAIREIYCLTYSLLEQARYIIRLQEICKPEDYRKFHETFNEFQAEWSKNKIFFSENLAQKIENLVFNIYIDIMGTVSDDITESCGFKGKELPPDELKKLATKVTETFPSIMKEIESNFRQLIGVE